MASIKRIPCEPNAWTLLAEGATAVLVTSGDAVPNVVRIAMETTKPAADHQDFVTLCTRTDPIMVSGLDLEQRVYAWTSSAITLEVITG